MATGALRLVDPLAALCLFERKQAVLRRPCCVVGLGDGPGIEKRENNG
jgi:hypothetical protein